MNAVNEAAAAALRIRRRLALGVALPALLALGGVALWAAAQSWAPARELAWARGTGWIAFSALLLSLSVTPAGRIAARLGLAPPPALPVLRRALGMASAWLALLHALLSLAGTLGWNWNALWTWPHLRAGVSALLLLCVLLLTSFARVIAALRLRFWRELHRLAYVAPLLVLQHVLLSPFGSRGLALGLVAAACALGLARCL